MLRNHEAYTVAKTTVCMCGGVWVCVAYKYRLGRLRGDWSSGGYMPLCPPRSQHSDTGGRVVLYA